MIFTLAVSRHIRKEKKEREHGKGEGKRSLTL